MMGKHKWTSGEEKLLVDSILAGCSRADICDKLGLSESVVYNHYRAMRATDKTLPMFPRAEKTVVVSEDQAEPHETKAKKVELNPLEKEMADIITENNVTIENLRIDLETEQEARELEAAAYRNEVKRLTDQVTSLKGTVSAQGDELAAKDKLIKKVYGDLDRARIERDEAQNLLRLQRENDETEWATPEEERALANGIIDAQRKELASALDEAANLSDMLHERDEVIFAMAKAIFLGPKEVLLA